MFRNILLATDGSAASGPAAALAVELARSHGSTLHVVYVTDPYPYLGIGDTNPAGLNAYLASAHQHAAQAHTAVVQLCGDGVAVQAYDIEGATAVDGILRTAQEQGADLVVMGSHGRSGFKRLLLGSVAAKVVAQSPVPVLVVPQADGA